MEKHKKNKSKSVLKKILLIILLIIILIVGYVVFKVVQDRTKFKKISELYFMGIDNTEQVGKVESDISYDRNLSFAIEYPIINNDTADKIIKAEVDTFKQQFTNEYLKQDFDIETANLSDIEFSLFIHYETYIGPNNTMGLILYVTEEAGDTNVISEKAFTYNFDLLTGNLLKSSDIFKDGYKTKLGEYIKNYLDKNEEYKEVLSTSYEDKISNTEDSLNKYIVTSDKIIVYFDKYDVLPGSYGIVKVEIPYTDIKDVLNIKYNKETKVPDSNVGVNSKNDTANYTKTNETVYAKVIVNIRKEDSASSEKLGMLNKGDSILRTGVGDNGWSKVDYNGTEAYISSTYLTTEKPADVTFADANETVYAIATVNVRESYSTSSNILGKLSTGDSITRTSKGDNGWSKVSYNGKEAYVSSSYLSTTMPVSNDIPVNVDPQRGIDPSKPMVALTFDDGPNPKSTPRILETLQKYNVVATFFDLGSLVNTYPNIVKQEAAIGCAVGSHTYSHKNLNTLSSTSIKSEEDKTDEAFIKVLGSKPTLIRPPYGNANSTVKTTLSDYALINWDIDTLDWKSRNKDSILSEIRKYSNYDGRIILMHSIYGTTADAVEIIVPELISKGYQLVTVPELATYKGVTLESGKVYYDFR